MRKTILLVLAVMVLVCSCGSKVPDGMSERGYEIGKNAIKTVTDYNNGSLTGDEAVTKVDEYINRLTQLTDKSDEYYQDLALSIQLDAFRIAVVNGGDTFEVEDKIKEILEQ